MVAAGCLAAPGILKADWAHASTRMQPAVSSTKDPHGNQGPRRLARIGGEVVAVAEYTSNHDHLYRSSDDGPAAAGKRLTSAAAWALTSSNALRAK